MGVAPGGDGGGARPLPIILPNYRIKVHFFRPLLEKFGPLCVISWKNWTSTWKNVILYVPFSEKSGPLPEKCGPLRMIFWKKWTSTWKCGPFPHEFLKKVDLRLKNVDLHAWFSEKSGPWPENVDLLRMIFWKKWTSSWKCGPFTEDLLKKVDLNLKNVDLYAWFSEKKWTSTWKCGPFTHDFLKKVDLNLKNVDLLRMIFLKKWTSTWKMWTF